MSLAITASANASLLERSPFMPLDGRQPNLTAPPPASAEQSQIQFKGVFALNDEVRFNLFNSRENKGSWVRLNEEFAGVSVVAFDEDTRSIDIETNGAVTRLSIIDASDSPLPVFGTPRNIIAQINTGQRRPTITQSNQTPRRAISRRRVVPPSPPSASSSSTQTQSSPATNTNIQGTEDPTATQQVQHSRTRTIRHED